MPTTFQYIFRILLPTIALSPCFTIACGMVVNQRPSWKAYLLCAALSAAANCIGLFVIGRDSPFVLVTSVCVCVGMMAFGFHQRGIKLLYGATLALAVTFLGDVIGGIILTMTFDDGMIHDMRYALSPYVYLLNIIVSGCFLITGGLYSVARNLLTGKRLRGVFRVLRLSALLIIAAILFSRTIIRVNTQGGWHDTSALLPDFIIVAALLFITVTYIFQDILYVAQKKKNQVLLSQRETQDTLLKETRFFRHNIANLLYGFQGTLLSRDFAAVDQYYRRMVETCAMINNENILALRRIPSLPFSTLLLHKIKGANDANIPFYVAVDDNLEWHGLKNTDMCEVAGILLDNALEAARESRAPYLSLELHGVKNGMEMVARNTYREETLPALLSAHGAAPGGKPGGEGIGLRSVEDILRRYHNVAFNIYRQGRYVEADLVIYG